MAWGKSSSLGGGVLSIKTGITGICLANAVSISIRTQSFSSQILGLPFGLSPVHFGPIIAINASHFTKEFLMC
jgi:hypothetical protein